MLNQKLRTICSFLIMVKKLSFPAANTSNPQPSPRNDKKSIRYLYHRDFKITTPDDGTNATKHDWWVN